MAQYSSRPRVLICDSSAVAMLVCLSMIFFRSCSSGRDATALTRFCVLAPTSASSAPTLLVLSLMSAIARL